MALRLNQVTLAMTDAPASIAFYEALGFTLIVDAAPRYVRFEAPAPGDGGEPTTLSLRHEPGWTGCDWPLSYLEVEDVDAQLERLKPLGLRPLAPAETRSYLWREADLRDPAGNRLRLHHAGAARRFPPGRVGGAGRR
ncbi:MAG: VOC family protein [Caulobacterales bacterium]|nr:VOC family protein [Caulobacterales bacterium]